MTSTSRRDFMKSAALAPLALAPFALKAGPRDPSRTEVFDYVVAGAGHNSLICAAYLAKAGSRVLVLEGRPMIGGGVKTAEILLPGFKQDLCSSSHHLIARNPLLRNNELDLRDYGYETFDPEVVVHFPFLDGASLTVFLKDPERTAATIARVSKKDAETFIRLAAARAATNALPPAERAQSARGLVLSAPGRLVRIRCGAPSLGESGHAGRQSLRRAVARRSRERSRYGCAGVLDDGPLGGPADAQGWLGDAECGAGTIHRGARRRHPDRQAGRATDDRERQMHGCGVHGRQQVPGAKSGGLHDSRQASLGDGAPRTLG